MAETIGGARWEGTFGTLRFGVLEVVEVEVVAWAVCPDAAFLASKAARTAAATEGSTVLWWAGMITAEVWEALLLLLLLLLLLWWWAGTTIEGVFVRGVFVGSVFFRGALNWLEVGVGAGVVVVVGWLTGG